MTSDGGDSGGGDSDGGDSDASDSGNNSMVSDSGNAMVRNYRKTSRGEENAVSWARPTTFEGQSFLM